MAKRVGGMEFLPGDIKHGFHIARPHLESLEGSTSQLCTFERVLINSHTSRKGTAGPGLSMDTAVEAAQRGEAAGASTGSLWWPYGRGSGGTKPASKLGSDPA